MLMDNEFCSAFKGDIIGKEIIYLDSVTSTMDAAIEIGRGGDNFDGTVIVADVQTGGKGRFGRKWISPAGVNLYFTVLLKPDFRPENASMITITAAVAVAKAIRQYPGLKAEIKWPNDILVKGKKTAGILTEMKSVAGLIELLAVGIGVNVNMTSEMMVSDIRDIATSLKLEQHEDVNRITLFRGILSELEKYYKILLNGNKGALINEWLSLNSTIGRKVMVRNQDSVETGVAEGLSDQGALILRLESGETRTINAGDVTIL